VVLGLLVVQAGPLTLPSPRPLGGLALPPRRDGSAGPATDAAHPPTEPRPCSLPTPSTPSARACERISCWPTSTIYLALVALGVSSLVLQEIERALGSLLDLQGAGACEALERLLSRARTVPAPPPTEPCDLEVA
jgi:hypothetical protein